MSENNQTVAVYGTAKDLTSFLKTGRSALEAALPRHLNADRMLRLAVTAFSTNPQLRQCTGMSILGSLIVAAQIGLEPGIAGQGYLIPYFDRKNNVSICTFVPGWQGLVGLLNNSGRATAWTGAVFEGDEWEFELGSNPKCRHIPGENYGDPDKMIWVYACGKVNGSEQPVIEAWPLSRVWRHRDRFNKVGNRHYSFQHPEMYARKVVLLQVLKYMPRSVELQNAIAASDAAEIGNTSRVEGGIVVDVPMEPAEITKGQIGAGEGNPLETAAAGDTKAASGTKQGEEKKAEPPSVAPDADKLRAQFLKEAKAANIGKAMIVAHFGGEEQWLALSADTLQSALDEMPATLDAIKNPGEPS